MSSPANNSALLIHALGDYITQAEALLKLRDTDGLAKLNGDVDAMCQHIGAMDATGVETLAPQIDEVMARLASLQAGMEALQQEIATTMKSINKGRKAAHAYHNAPEA